jgi:hypothetical protein
MARAIGAHAGAKGSSAVRIVPYVAEQPPSGGAALQPPALPVAEVIRRAGAALSDDVRRVAGRGLTDAHFWGSSLRRFLKRTAPALPRLAVVVSHGNFLTTQVCGARLCGAPIPNGGVLKLAAGDRTFFFVRHCLTCHNINKAGSSALTACHDFAALKPAQELVRALRSRYGDRLWVCSSPLPRAVLTAVALQRDVTDLERRAFCRAFGACAAPIPPEEAARHAERWSCARASLALSPFCGARVTRGLNAEEHGEYQQG